MYVPFEQTTRKLTSGRATSVISNTRTSTVREGSSTDRPFLARVYERLPPTLTAECAGGVCRIMPVNFLVASNRDPTGIPDGSAEGVTSVSRSCEAVVEPDT